MSIGKKEITASVLGPFQARGTRHTSVGRLAALRALLETNAVSLIEGLCSIAALKEAIERGTIGAGLVTVEAKAVLGLG
jgi:hypothetical protein